VPLLRQAHGSANPIAYTMQPQNLRDVLRVSPQAQMRAAPTLKVQLAVRSGYPSRANSWSFGMHCNLLQRCRRFLLTVEQPERGAALVDGFEALGAAVQDGTEPYRRWPRLGASRTAPVRAPITNAWNAFSKHQLAG
jgi:hypothetical protein